MFCLNWAFFSFPENNFDFIYLNSITRIFRSCPGLSVLDKKLNWQNFNHNIQDMNRAFETGHVLFRSKVKFKKVCEKTGSWISTMDQCQDWFTYRKFCPHRSDSYNKKIIFKRNFLLYNNIHLIKKGFLIWKIRIKFSDRVEDKTDLKSLKSRFNEDSAQWSTSSQDSNLA